MADKLCTCFGIEGERSEVIRCASLLHDIGHGPYSRLFENIMVKINEEKFTHEDVTEAIIQYNDDIRIILEGRLDTRPALSNIHSQV
jgi:HD superfamily phosphohydrolase